MAVLEVKDMKKNFGKASVLKGVSFSLEKGEVLAVIGSSGGGKTTICHLIPHFYDVTDGGIYVDGREIHNITLDSLRKNIGISTIKCSERYPLGFGFLM